VRLTARIGEYYNRRKEVAYNMPIIHFAVAAHEYTNAMGERFWRVYSKKNEKGETHSRHGSSRATFSI
jgi:hypothetical protein